MRRLVTAGLVASLLALPMSGQAIANHPHDKWVKGPKCGGKFKNADQCSFRYKGGYFYLGGSVRAADLPAAAVLIRLEAVSRTTGRRYVISSCWTAASGSPGQGACVAVGSYEVLERVQKGDKLFCIVEGAGRGDYECGTMIKKRSQ